MNAQLTSRIKPDHCVVYLKHIPQGLSESAVADLLWSKIGIAISPEDISIRANSKTGKYLGALALISRETAARWLNACLLPTLGIEVQPAECGVRPPERSKVLTNRNGIQRLVVMGREK